VTTAALTEKRCHRPEDHAAHEPYVEHPGGPDLACPGGPAEPDTTGCIQVVDGEEVLGPFCMAASRAAVLRLSTIDMVSSLVGSALEQIDEQPSLAKAMLRDALDGVTKAEDAQLERVPRDEALLALVEELQNLISTDPRSLLEQAITAVDTLTTGGWVLVRAEGLR
jgi:hypothetical protein